MNDNYPLAIETARGLSINYQGKSLYSKYNPSRTPVQIAENTILKNETLYIIPSPLLLYGVDILLEKLPVDSFIVGIEVDQKLMKLSLESSNAIIHPYFKYARLETREQLKSLIEDLGTWKYRRCEIVPLNSGYNLYQSEYDRLFQFASFVLSTFWRNRLTINKLGKLWIKNTFINSKSITTEIPDNEGKPVVVCGAGASLEQSLSILKKYRDNLYIMAVDTALSSLVESEIIPDLVFALEAQFYNLGDFYNLSDHKIDLLTDITGYPPVCREISGQVYNVFTDFFENNLLKRLEDKGFVKIKIPPLGSVGVAAVATALQIFQSNIFLTGLDFSFIPGKSHSKGSPFSNSLLRSSNRMKPADSYKISIARKIISVPGKLPDTIVYTDHVLDTYAKLLNDIISGTDRVYDLTQTGYPLGATFTGEKLFSQLVKVNDQNTKEIKEAENKIPSGVDFLLHESELLLNLIIEWERFNESDTDEIPESLMNALTKVDYVYVDFPDRLPHPIKDVSFISRSVLSARYYREIIAQNL